VTRNRGALADREGDRHHSRRQAGRKTRAHRRAPEAAKAVRSYRPREVAAKDRGRQGLALGRSGREGGSRGSTLRLPAEAPAGGTRERGGEDGGGARIRGHRLGAHRTGDGRAAQGGLARPRVPGTVIPRLHRPVETFARPSRFVFVRWPARCSRRRCGRTARRAGFTAGRSIGFTSRPWKSWDCGAS